MNDFIVIRMKHLNKLSKVEKDQLSKILSKVRDDSDFIVIDKREIHADAVQKMVDKGERIKAELKKPIKELGGNYEEDIDYL